MPEPSITDRLAGSPLLAALDAESRDALVPLFTTETFSAGERLVTAGSSDRDLMVVVDGSLHVFTREGDLRYRLATLGPGDVIGEVAFFDPQAYRTADVVAATDVVVAKLSPDAYVNLRRRAHPAASSLETQVVRLLVGRLQAADTLLATLLDDHRSGRLALSIAGLFGAPSVGSTS
jgi:CRP-like cAMP-binding protein